MKPGIEALLAASLVCVATAGAPSAGADLGAQQRGGGDRGAESADLKPAPREPDVIFVPTPDSVVAAMLDVARVGGNDVLYDLGSGDGRIVITAARKFATRGIGVDIDPERVREARANARKAGVTDRVTFLQQDLFETDIREATVVSLYLLPDLNVKLRPTLLRELKPGSRVVSHAYDMGEWQPDSAFQADNRSVFFWIIPANVAGTWRWSTKTPSGARRYELRLQQRFQKVQGTLSVGGERFTLHDVRLRGDRLTFTGVGSPEGDLVEIRFTGRAAGDTLTGAARLEGRAGPREETWRATRTSKS